ncbi:MAG: UDP-N-acetylmuramoyl-L-alanyl-D-glutamate--2,6-diaminopimelate ligase [Candidatus Babeliales bacterium]|nr:UDP-N-acetylmuramoyl-L-alanyl-D-glutamate--2,6-diaminopimelate ligase [Candidatus Babeliales bacterium]
MNMNLVMPSIYPVACHTDNVGHDSTFVAIKGQREDGTRYIIDALQKGASTIVIEDDVLLPDEILGAIDVAQAEVVRVANSRLALAQLSAQAANYPARKLRILAVTGTKGKTTSSFLLEHILRNAGYKTALLSTVKNKIGNQEFKTNLTTQHPDYLHNFFALCVDAQVEYVIMEVAAQATSLHRSAGLAFDGLIFTNFDQEHAEFYPSMQEYFAAKVALIDQLKRGAPLLFNADDAWVGPLARHYQGSLQFGIATDDVDYHTTICGNTLDKLELVITNKKKSYNFECPSLIGAYNAYNVLGVVALCKEIGLSDQQIAQGLSSFVAVPGRLERYALPNGASCFIDYAHNPSSYQAVLSMMRSLTDNLIVVFGAGGARDKTKRPVMGAVAAQIADVVILTSDNPRTEDPQMIVQDILAGISEDNMHKVICDLDREQAIKKAYAQSKAGSVIMLLGKGPDEYQIIGDKKTYFSESAIVKELV